MVKVFGDPAKAALDGGPVALLLDPWPHDLELERSGVASIQEFAEEPLDRHVAVARDAAVQPGSFPDLEVVDLDDGESADVFPYDLPEMAVKPAILELHADAEIGIPRELDGVGERVDEAEVARSRYYWAR